MRSYQRGVPYLVLLLIGIVVLLPIFWARNLVKNSHALDFQTTNKGVLLQPVLLQSELGTPTPDGVWHLVHVATLPPAEIAALERVIIALGKDSTRVVLTPLSGAFASGLAQVQQVSPANTQVWIVDPLGNWMMAYPEGLSQRAILDDLHKLLKASKIG